LNETIDICSFILSCRVHKWIGSSSSLIDAWTHWTLQQNTRLIAMSTFLEKAKVFANETKQRASILASRAG
jgi:hypothetical protein